MRLGPTAPALAAAPGWPGRGRRVEIDVTDDGTAAPGPGTGGLGLVGMRERVAVYGGTVQAGPLAQGGYQVRAMLPFETGERVLP